MAWICDKNGNHRCEIKQLSYNGTFMEVSSITVTVESPAPIAFAIGDYIDWDYDGLRYTLDTAAGVEKQARRNSVGNAFLYENLVFLSPLQAAQNADFFDVILGNTNDFLTNTEFSFYGTAWDYAKRLEANLCRLYGSGTWKVRIWTNGTCYDATPATGIDAGAWENKLVDVSGIKCLGGFQQIYDLWGCAYVFSVVSGVNYVDFYDDFEQYAKAWQAGGMDKIFAYGKGSGLYKIRHTPDADHVLVTRLRPYGSGDNIPANYYLNSEDYHVDGNESSELAISHLMLPASQWTKDGVKHPANAYLEQNTDLYGVREGVVLWDGSDPELGEIKPSIYRLTIQDLLNLMASGDSYRPDEAKWPDTTQRIDKIITGAAPTDNGVKNEAGYDFTEVESSGSLAAHSFGTGGAYIDVEFNDLVMGTTPSVSHLAEFRIVPTSENKVAASFDVQASVASAIRVVNAYLTPYVGGVKISNATHPCTVTEEAISNTVEGITYTKRYKISLLNSTGNPIVFSSMYTGNVTFRIVAHIDFTGNPTGFPVVRNEYAVSFNLLRGNKAIDEYFSVTIPQIGFDLSAAVANGAKLCMRSGANQPREFQIIPSFVRYLPDTDTWFVRCKRSVDQSISTYFPNSNAVIAAGDEYYFTGITMPPLYVEIAAQKLLEAATAWLALHSKPRMLSAVDVDNKVMAVEEIVLKEGMSLPISDTDLDIQPGTQESRIIDNIRIEEGSDAIRTFSVTLRDKKEKSSLDAAIRGATSNLATNSSVNEAVSAAVNTGHGSLAGRDMPNQHPISAITGLEEALLSSGFFELGSPSGLVKLKSNYDFLGPRKGLIFDVTSEEDYDDSPAHLMLRNLGTPANPNYALYTPYAIISGGDQIVGSGTPGGGGGGGAGYLYEAYDVSQSISGKPSARKMLVFDPSGTDKNGDPGAWVYEDIPTESISSVSLAQGASGKLHLVVNGTAQSDVAVPGLGTAAFANADTFAAAVHSHTVLQITDFPSTWAWSDISGKPSTLSGYGITDGVNDVEVTGTGNAVTAASISGHKLTLTKGTTFLTGNQTITLSGDVSGSGTTSIAVSIGAGKVTNTMLAGSIAWGKLSVGASDIVSTLGSTPVNRATADASGNNIASTYQTILDTQAMELSLSEGISSNDARITSLEDWLNNPSFAEFYCALANVDVMNVGGILIYWDGEVGALRIDGDIVTNGDQIVLDGAPGGGGGGGAGYLYELGDVYSNDDKVLRANGSERVAGDLLAFDSTHGWVAFAQSSLGIAISQVAGLQTALDNKVNNSAISDMATKTWVNQQGFVTSSGVTNVATGTGLSGGPITSTGTISISSTYQTYISHGETAYGWGNHASAGYASAADVLAVELALSEGVADNAARITSLEDWLANPSFAELYAGLLNADEINIGGSIFAGIEGVAQWDGSAFFSSLSSNGATITAVVGGQSRSQTLTSIPNSSLTNSAITINGTATSLGGSFSTGNITAGTAGQSSASSGTSFSIPYVTMNKYGIVTGYGTHTHTISAAELVSTLGTTPVNRATADASGNVITSTYQTKTDTAAIELTLAEGIAENAARLAALEAWLNAPALAEMSVTLLNVEYINLGGIIVRYDPSTGALYAEGDLITTGDQILV